MEEKKVKFTHPVTKEQIEGTIEQYITIGPNNDPRAVVESDDGELFTFALSEVWTDKRLAAEDKAAEAKKKALADQKAAQDEDDKKVTAQRAAIEADQKRAQEVADFEKQNPEDPNTEEGQRLLKEKGLGILDKAKEVRSAQELKSNPAADADDDSSDAAPATTKKSRAKGNADEGNTIGK